MKHYKHGDDEKLCPLLTNAMLSELESVILENNAHNWNTEMYNHLFIVPASLSILGDECCKVMFTSSSTSCY